jgi:5'-nucleotidase / UDP-sugar diphosphatase
MELASMSQRFGHFSPWVHSSVVALGLLSVAGCGGGSDSPVAQPFEMTVLHINDHHSHLDAETTSLLLKNAAGTKERVTADLGGFARVKSAFDDLAVGKPNVIKLHAGDALTGDLYFTLDEGKSDAAMMNTVCFDAFTLGNHEFDNGDTGLKKFLDFLHLGTCKTPVLSANLKPASTSALGPIGQLVKPSTVITRGTERIGVVGLTIGGKTKASSRPDSGTTFEDEATAAQREIDALKAQGINKIVLLTHYTYKGDQALAPKLSGVDVIVGGDSHTLLGDPSLKDFGLSPEGNYPTLTTNKDGKTVCIVQAWQYSYVVGEIKVKFDGNGDVLECPGTPHILIGDTFKRGSTVVAGADAAAMQADVASQKSLRITQPSAAATAVLAPFASAKAELGTKVIGRSSDILCLRRVPGTKRDASRSTLGDVCNKDARVNANGGDIQQIVAWSFLDHAKNFGSADIALQNGGGVRTDVAASDITVGRVYSVLPFKNLLVRLTMTGAQIKTALEEGIDFSMGSGGSGAYPYTANLRFNVDLNQVKGSRVSALQFKNAEGAWVSFDLNADYKLITSDFLANGGDGYLSLKTFTGNNREDTYLDYADPLLQYVKTKTPIARLPVSEYSTQVFVDTP